MQALRSNYLPSDGDKYANPTLNIVSSSGKGIKSRKGPPAMGFASDAEALKFELQNKSAVEIWLTQQSKAPSILVSNFQDITFGAADSSFSSTTAAVNSAALSYFQTLLPPPPAPPPILLP